MAISGAHVIIYSADAGADRDFLRDVLRYPHVDVGGGWLIFKLPPAEVAVHPSEGAAAHELYLMCDDIDETVAELGAQGVEFADIAEEQWGRVSSLRLPGGSDLGIYEPRHPRATELH